MSKAIFLGTFNPPHQGHRNVILSVCDWYSKKHIIDLEQIFIIPCWQNPNKEYVTSYWDRYKMCLQEFYGALPDYVLIDDIEAEIKPKYTYDLIKYFKSNKDLYIKDDFYWIITNETFNELWDNKWYNSEWLLDNNRFILIEEDTDKTNWQHYYDIDVHHVPLNASCGIHSTNIRNKFWNNTENYNQYLRQGTKDYIIEHKLYINE